MSGLTGVRIDVAETGGFSLYWREPSMLLRHARIAWARHGGFGLKSPEGHVVTSKVVPGHDPTLGTPWYTTPGTPVHPGTLLVVRTAADWTRNSAMGSK